MVDEAVSAVSAPAAPAINSTAFAGLSDADKAVVSRSLERAGFAKADIDKAGAAKPTPSPQPAQPQQPAQNADFTKATFLPEGDAVRWARQYVKDNPQQMEQVRQAVQADYGIDITAHQADAWDDAFGVPAGPEGYNLNLLSLNPYMDNPTEIKAGFQEAFKAMHIPGAMAQTMAETLIQTADTWQAMNEVAAGDHWNAERQKIADALGGKDYESVKEWVQKNLHASLNALPAQQRDELIESGALHSAASVLLLARNGERLLSRQ